MALTEKQINEEIARLKSSDEVRLARKAQRIGKERESYLYALRWQFKKGKQLMEQGYTMENIREKLFPESVEEEGYNDEE